MKPTEIIYAGLLLLGTLSCSQNGLSPNQYSIQGTWRLYEVGGSTGFRYIVTPVPANPIQTLSFIHKSGPLSELHSQGEELSIFSHVRYYLVDPTQTEPRLSLLTDKNDKPTYSDYSAVFRIQGDTMRIMPTCRDGCHYSFVKIR